MTNHDVVEVLKGHKACKSTGIGNINSRLLKIAAPVIAPSITNMMDMSIEIAISPMRWKTAKVIPLCGDDNVTNYRPISILPVLAKVIERHVHNHFYSYMAKNNLMYGRQSGFRRQHSSETALIKIIDTLLFDMDNNHITGMVLVGYQKAFDMVDHSLLLLKLKIYGLDDHAISWITFT